MPVRRDQKVVKILADKPVQYSVDNGLTASVFDPGKVYAVPDYVAWGMERRNWAKIITEDEVETQDTTETTIDVKDLRGKKE